MAKVFLKSFYVSFLWLILFLNIIFVFDLLGQIPLTSATGIDYSNKYFGISTLVDFIKSLDVETDFPFMASIRGFITDIQSNVNDFLNTQFWVNVNIPITDMVSFFASIGLVFGKIFTFIGWGFTMMFCATCWIVYFLMYLLGLIFVFIKLLSGNYYSVYYPSGLLESSSLMFMSSMV